MKNDRRKFPLVLMLMFLSGAAALVYEIVWMRMLSRTFGVTVYAVTSVVSLYMTGLMLGAAAGARMRPRANWLRLYAWLEAGAGAAALLGTWWLWRLPALTASWSSAAPLATLPRLLLAAPALLPATILLGATLPALVRNSGSPGSLYAANTLGAMTGLAAASFWTLGTWGETATLMMAAGFNAAAAAAAFAMSRSSKVSAPHANASAGEARAPFSSLVPALFAVSGFCALGYEIIWSRQLIPLLGNSTYAFALVLIVYLGGIGLGSLLKINMGENPLEAFGMVLTSLGSAAVLSLAAQRFLGLRLDSPRFLYSPLADFGDFKLIAMQAVIIVLPVSLLLGVLFPVAVRACGNSADEGKVAGNLYAWNTVGGTLGALWAGFIGVSWFGTHGSFLLLAGLQTAAGLAALAAASIGRRRLLAPAACVGFSLCVAAYAWRDPSVEILANRLGSGGVEHFTVMFNDESPAATITGISYGDSKALYINGIETSGNSVLGTLMGVLPNLFVDAPKSTLVICLGAGNTVRAVSNLGGDVDAVELVGDVARRMPLFQARTGVALAGDRTRVFIEDGRNFLLRTSRRYDVVIVDAAPPLYSAGTVNLYTKEFMELVRAHLNDGGVFALWLPTLSFESDYWQIMRGMSDTFAHLAVWQKSMSGFLVLGSSRSFDRAPGTLDRLIKERDGSFHLKGLTEPYILAGLQPAEAELRAYLRNFDPVTDDRPSVEFPLARFWRREPLEHMPDFLLHARTAARAP